MEDQQRYVAVVELDGPGGIISSTSTGPTGPPSFIGSSGPDPIPPAPLNVITTQTHAPSQPPPDPQPAPPAATIHSTIPLAQPGDYSTWNGNPVHVNVSSTNPGNTGPGDYSTWNGSAQPMPTITPSGPVSVRTSTQPTMNYTGHLESSIVGPMLVHDGETPRALVSRPEYSLHQEPAGKSEDDRYISRIIPSKEPILRPRGDLARASNRSSDQRSNISKANTDTASKKQHLHIPNGLHNKVQLDISMTGSKTMTLGTSGNTNGDIVVDGDVGKTGRTATITWGTVDTGDDNKEPRLVDENNKDKDPDPENKPFWPSALQERKKRDVIFGIFLAVLLALLVIAFIVVLVILYRR